MENSRELPGWELVARGIDDLELGIESIESLLVSMAASSLTELGLAVSAPLSDPEQRLYSRLAAELGDAAHARYNALRRRLTSYIKTSRCASQ